MEGVRRPCRGPLELDVIRVDAYTERSLGLGGTVFTRPLPPPSRPSRSALEHRTSFSRPFNLIKGNIGCIHYARCRASVDTTVLGVVHTQNSCLAHPVPLYGSHRTAFVHARTGQKLRMPDAFDALPTPFCAREKL